MADAAARLAVHRSADAYLAAAGEWLAPQEAEASLMLGIPMRIQAQGGALDPEIFLATVHFEAEQKRAVGAAFWTPPWPLVVHADVGREREVAQLVASDLLRQGRRATGVNGRVPGSAAFVDVWRELTGETGELVDRMRIYELRVVLPPRSAPGFLRDAMSADAPLIFAWLQAFYREALPRDAFTHTVESVAASIAEGRFALWQSDGEAVTLVGHSRKLPRGDSVSWVYTPPPARRRGFASNAVAAFSQRLLDEGNEYCCLFTDLSNPTSNHIYQVIGYRPLCEYARYTLGPS
jgi:predicted GNAT family acetyltransferase